MQNAVTGQKNQVVIIALTATLIVCISLLIITYMLFPTVTTVITTSWTSGIYSISTPTPKKIYLTFKSAERVPHHIWQQYQQLAPEYDYEFYDDGACIESLLPFGDAVLNRYHSMQTPAHRCDLWRYCMLYQYGGVYMDIKTLLKRPVSDIFQEDIFH